MSLFKKIYQEKQLLIEKNTNYSILVNIIKEPSFECIRRLSVNFVNQLPEDVRTILWENLNNGVDVLESEALLSMYMFAYGKMHAAKLHVAYEHLPTGKLDEIQIIDWGCGQGIASLVFCEFIKENGINSNVKTITLIEPSDLALKRAALHVRKIYPNANIVTIKKEFNNITHHDLTIKDDDIVLHLFSNVLDVDGFDINHLVELIKYHNAYNLLVCVSPYINDFKNQRLNIFASSFQNASIIAEYRNKNWQNGWTIDYKIFEVNSLKKKGGLFKKIYGGSYVVSASLSLSKEAPDIQSAVIIEYNYGLQVCCPIEVLPHLSIKIEGHYGLQVCCTMINGRVGYLPLSRNSTLSVGDNLPLASARVLVLSKDGSPDIIRIIEK